MTKYEDILEAEAALTAAKTRYLRRFGWKETCNTPGSFWLWKRDFAAEDAVRLEWWEKTNGPLGKPSKPTPMGVITLPLEQAITATQRELDCDDEDEEGDTP